MLDAGLAGIIVATVLLIFLAAGVHIGVALGLGGLLGIYLTMGPAAAFGQLATVPFGTTNSFTLAVIPLFILMGAVATNSEITTDVYSAAHDWLVRIRGGLAMATILASAAFGAACGSTMVNAAVFTRMALPEMTKYGYSKRLSAGCIAASGTLASLIPPSILMVIYGVVTEQSIGKLLIAGFIPGVMSAFIYLGGVSLLVRFKPQLAPNTETLNIPWARKFKSLYKVWAMVALFVLVIGGIYTGFFTPTYAGAIGAFGAFVIALGKRRMNAPVFVETIKDAVVTTSVIFIIVVGGMIFARFLTYTGLVAEISQWMLGRDFPAFFYFICFAILYLFLGMFIEPIAIMVLTLPVMFPIMVGAGYNPIWLGVISIKLAEISLITPPVGLNVYVVKSASPIPLSLEDVFAGILPFIVLDVITLAILISFPQISIFLPNLMSY